MTKVKLCGLTRPQDIVTANGLRPDYIGFVFAPKSSRFVTPGQAFELKQALSPDIKSVGVFVNAPLEEMQSLVRDRVIDLIQLHGEESEQELEKIRQITGAPIIRAFQIKGKEDLIRAANSVADYILLDSGAGTGTAFDWELLRNFEKPYFLAGGLNPDTVGKAIEILHPYGVDVSSGIETGGIKDAHKMKAFMEAVPD